MSSKETKTVTRYRDTTTGHFVPDSVGKYMPKSDVVRERVPKSGYGDTKPNKR